MVEREVGIQKLMKKLGYYLLTIFACGVVFFPIYWLINCSFQKESDLFSFPPRWIPAPFCFDGYQKLFVQGDIWKWISNTAIVTVITVVITLVFAVMAGYSFSRFNYRGKNLLSLLLLSTQMISGPMIITPLFIVLSKMGLVNTFSSLIITDIAVNMAVATWLMKGFFDTIPVEIEEAAVIDGATRMGILWRITLPLCLTGIVTILVLTFFVTWNEYLYGLIFISDQKKWIGSVGLASFIGSYVVSQDQILAGATIFSVVPILFFMVFQRFIVAGLTQGSVKG